MNSKFLSTQQVVQFMYTGSYFFESPDTHSNLLVLVTPKRFYESPSIENHRPIATAAKILEYGTKTVEVQY